MSQIISNTYPQSVVEENNLTFISKIQLNQIDVFNELFNIYLKTVIIIMGPYFLIISNIFTNMCIRTYPSYYCAIQ